MRMSIAQRRALEAEQRAAEQAAVVAVYPTVLMSTLEAACSVYMELTVYAGKFVVFDRDTSKQYVMAPTYDPTSNVDLRDLMYETEQKVEAKRVEMQKAVAREAALAKLSPEEKELLGL